MRYRLRTLLIWMAIAPPLIAAGWLGYCKWREFQEWERGLWGGFKVTPATAPPSQPPTVPVDISN